jgi:tetratricopeptide (TPR) repeat protein
MVNKFSVWRCALLYLGWLALAGFAQAQTIELNLPDAARQANELSRPDLKRAQLLLDNARSKRVAREYDRALIDAEAALLLFPRDLPARYLRAILLADLGRAEAARASFEELTQDFPELPEPHNNLAVQQAALGQLDAARQSLLRALAIFPEYVVARENLGDVYVRLAQASYQAAVKSAGTKTATSSASSGANSYATGASETLKNKLQMTTDWLKR